MTLFPLVERELIVRARRPQNHWLRFAVAAVGVLLCLQFFIFLAGTNMIQAGDYAFQSVAWIVFLVACGGFALTVDSVGLERREGTLGLLFLTRAKIPDVLAGKLVSAGFASLLGLIAVMPIMTVPVLMGGVRWGQVLFVALSLPGLLFFSLCLGLWVSSTSTSIIRAMIHATLWMLGLAGLPLILAAASSMGIGSLQVSWIGNLSPVSAFFIGSTISVAVPQIDYWSSVAAGFLLGVLFLMLAARNLKHNWSEEEQDADSHAAHRATSRTPLGDKPPMAWLLRRSKSQLFAVWAGIILLLALPSVMVVLVARLGVGAVGIGGPIRIVSSFIGSLALSYAGAQCFLSARRTGALELVRTTPVGFDRIGPDQWLVLRQRITLPLLLVLASSTVLRLNFWGSPGNQLLQLIVSLTGQVFDVLAICWLGMWFGYRAQSTWSALLWPVGLVVGLDIVLGYIVGFMLSIGFRSMTTGSGFSNSMVTLYLALYAAAPVAKQIWLIRWAKRRLNQALNGGMVEFIGPGRSVRSELSRAAASVRKARHWTGGAP